MLFFTRLLTLEILFSTAINAELVAKPVILGILFSISVILAFKSVLLASSLVSGIFLFVSLISVSYEVFKTNPAVSMLSTFVTNLSYSVFLTISFLLHYLTLLNH